MPWISIATAGSLYRIETSNPSRFELDFEDFFENGALALHFVGSDGIILHANKAELELLGFSAEEYIGHPISEFHADQEALEDILARLGRGESLRNIRPGCERAMAA